MRIVKGLSSPASRGRYVAEARKRLSERGSAKGRDRCLVCRSPELRHETVRSTRKKGRECKVSICRRCGYINNPENTRDYRAMENLDALPQCTRAGTHDRPGREYHMAKMAVDILARQDLEVLVYGAGRSLDNHHIATLPEVRHVAIGDIMKVRDDAEFIDANEPAPRRFPVIIASEVIEHFRDPREDFAKLFKLVERDGLIVCGTNIYAGGRLADDAYLFFSDHTSYYTPQALRTIASAAGLHIDFRTPIVGEKMRKRYVLFTRSAKVLEDVACYFGTQVYAPSEARRPPKRPALAAPTRSEGPPSRD